MDVSEELANGFGRVFPDILFYGLASVPGFFM